MTRTWREAIEEEARRVDLGIKSISYREVYEANLLPETLATVHGYFFKGLPPSIDEEMPVRWGRPFELEGRILEWIVMSTQMFGYRIDSTKPVRIMDNSEGQIELRAVCVHHDWWWLEDIGPIAAAIQWDQHA